MPDETEDTVTFDAWTEGDDKIALRVVGDAMIGEHIQDGDFVIIRRQDEARDGQIIALRDDDGCVTLRRYSRQMGRIWLEAANPAIKTVYRDSVEIIGVLVGVVRKY